MENFRVNPRIFDWRFKSKWKWEKKTTFEKYGENFTIVHDTIPSIRSQMTGENEEFQSQSREIWLSFQIEVKMEEKSSFQRQNLQNFAVLEENMPSIKCEMIGENAEFPVGSREIRSTIQVEV